VFKKIIPYIIIFVLSLFIVFFIFSGNNNTGNRISELEGILREISNNQQEIRTNIESIESAVNRIGTITNGITENNKRIENGIEQLKINDRRNTENIQKLLAGNTELKGISEQYRTVTSDIGRTLESIEARNK